MRNEPETVGRITAEPTADMVEDTAAIHRIERCFGKRCIGREQEKQILRTGELRLVAETAEHGIERITKRVHAFFDRCLTERARCFRHL